MDKRDWSALKTTVLDEAARLDKMIAVWLGAREESGKKIFCKEGCADCCTLFVQTSLPEALIIGEALNVEQVDKLENYISRQQESFAGEGEFLAILRKQRSTLGPCPFLDEVSCCSIYAQRPLACRALLSTKPAAWCGVDFTTLAPLDKRLYLESLERETVAFPIHYVAATQEAAQQAEGRILEKMQEEFSIIVSGNLPLLVYLARTLDIAAQISGGSRQWQTQLQQVALSQPHLLHISSATQSNCTQDS